MPFIEVRRAADRFTTRTDQAVTSHSFSFGAHYDPDNVRFGTLLAHNDDTVRPGGGYAPHLHRDVEIVTWVVRGRLAHQDSAGNSGVLQPGLIQRMSAGRGVTHAERNADAAAPVRFVQMWLMPDDAGLEPSYAVLDVGSALGGGDLVTVVSGPDHPRAGAVPINTRGAVLQVGRLLADRPVALPEAAYLHVFLASGAVALDGIGKLAEGDAVRLTGSGGQQVIATAAGTEILVWAM